VLLGELNDRRTISHLHHQPNHRWPIDVLAVLTLCSSCTNHWMKGPALHRTRHTVCNLPSLLFWSPPQPESVIGFTGLHCIIAQAHGAPSPPSSCDSRNCALRASMRSGQLAQTNKISAGACSSIGPESSDDSKVTGRWSRKLARALQMSSNSIRCAVQCCSEQNQPATCTGPQRWRR
jgi:hypothetical protein